MDIIICSRLVVQGYQDTVEVEDVLKKNLPPETDELEWLSDISRGFSC